MNQRLVRIKRRLGTGQQQASAFLSQGGMLTLACYNPAVKMEDWNDYKAPKPSLLYGDYCMDTTENDDEQFIPYSLRLLLEQKKKEEQLKSIRELHGNKE